MVPTGIAVKSGDVVVEFDPADQQFALDQSKSEVAEAEQEIAKMKADAAAQVAQDEVALLTARFRGRRAELDASANELIPAIEAQKNVLTARGGEARPRAARAGRQITRRDQQRVAGGRPREAQQGHARDAAGAAGDREPGAQGADRRGRRRKGQPGCDGRHDDLGHGDAGYREGDTVLAGPPCRRRHRRPGAWRCAPKSTRTTAPT